MQIKVQYDTTTDLLEWLELKRLTYLQSGNKDADVENRIVEIGEADVALTYIYYHV